MGAPVRTRVFPALLLAVALAVWLNAGSGAAQEPAPTVTVNQVESESYPDVTAYVTVLDAEGIPIAGLQPQAFTATEDGNAIAVKSVQQVQDATLPLAVVLVIDVSGSMAGEPLSAAKQAAIAFVNQLPPGDTAALFAFSTEVRPVVPFTSNKAELTNAINGLNAVGATSLYDAVQTAVFASGAATTQRRAVVVLSDGENESQSPVTAQQSFEAADQAGVPVFTVGFGAGADTSYLEEVARRTGGQFFRADTADVGRVYGAIAELLRSQYVLQLRSDGTPDGADGTLTVTVDVSGQQVTSAPVTFRRGTGVAPTAEPTATPVTEPPAEDDDAGGVSPMVYALAGMAGVAAVVGGGVVVQRRMRAARAQRQREVHAGRVSDEPLPPPAPGALPEAPELLGRIVALNGDAAGTAYEFGEVPIVIGSDAAATVRLPRGADVAPRHAQVWVRDGKMMLRHTGGSRPTMVGGRQVDWVILDPGDEFTIGGMRFRAEVASGRAAPSV